MGRLSGKRECLEQGAEAVEDRKRAPDDGGIGSWVVEAPRAAGSGEPIFLSEEQTALQAMLAELEPLLAGPDYFVSVRACHVPNRLEAPIEWYIAQALGSESAARWCRPATRCEILADVEVALRYVIRPGDK
jgi:hypothetical protein